MFGLSLCNIILLVDASYTVSRELCYIAVLFFFFFKQKTAYEMRISDWSSDVCSSDLQYSGGFNAYVACLMALLRRARDGGGDVIDLSLQESAIERSAERRVGKECVSTCRSRCSP